MRVQSLNKHFVTYPVNPQVCRIFGVGQEVMTLVEGTERAVLFDTGIGYGDLRAQVESMTDKPVTVVISHGHSDHVGGNGWFDEVYIHSKDIALAKGITLEERCSVAASVCVQRGYEAVTDMAPMVPQKDVVMHPVEGGYVFHLGGLDLEVIEMPGHTPGSIALLNEKDRYILTGDAVCRGTLLNMPGAPPMEIFRDMLRAFVEKYQGKIEYVLEAHGPCPDQFRIFEGNLDAVKGVLSGKYPGYQDAFGVIMGMPIYRAKPEVGIEGFCTDGMLGNITFVDSTRQG